jgi:glutathione S-transferase
MEVPYELERMNLGAGEQQDEEYLSINPNGTLPTLVDDGTVIYESAAIVMYLADRFPDRGMAPPRHTARRGLYYQWMMYATATLEPPIEDIFRHTKSLPEERRISAVVEDAQQRLIKPVEVLEAALGDRDYLITEFTSADVMIGSLLIWGYSMNVFQSTELYTYAERLKKRQGYRKATAD